MSEPRVPQGNCMAMILLLSRVFPRNSVDIREGIW